MPANNTTTDGIASGLQSTDGWRGGRRRQRAECRGEKVRPAGTLTVEAPARITRQGARNLLLRFRHWRELEKHAEDGTRCRRHG